MHVLRKGSRSNREEDVSYVRFIGVGVLSVTKSSCATVFVLLAPASLRITVLREGSSIKLTLVSPHEVASFVSSSEAAV